MHASLRSSVRPCSLGRGRTANRAAQTRGRGSKKTVIVVDMSGSNTARRKRPVVKVGIDVYLACGLLDEYVKSLSVAIKQESGFKTTPWCGYLGNKVRATCERPIGTALTTSPVFLLELIDCQTEVIVRYGAVRKSELYPDEWTVERFVSPRDWLTNLSVLLTRATPTIVREVQTALAKAGEIPSRK
jgi:hypothetical protein